MKPLVPHKFTTGQTLDPESVNDNLERISADSGKNMSRRYTYSVAIFPIEGLANTDSAAKRGIDLRAFAAANNFTVVGVDVVIYATAGVTWTLTATNSLSQPWESISVATAGTTTEARVNSDQPIEASSAVFTLTGSAASTIAAGYIVFTFRADRWRQGTTLASYAPNLFNAATSTAGATMDTEIAAIATAVALDGTADKDLRVEIYRVRALTSGSSKVWRTQGAARRKAGYVLGVVAAGGGTLTLTVDAASDSQAGSGASARDVKVGTLAGSATDGPMNSANDTIITLAATVATVDLGYALLFWS